MSYTRKRKGGSFFGRKPPTAIPSLTAKRNYNLAHSKSRVANVLAQPGRVSYTNKEAIQAKYEKVIAELQKIEKPQETASALQRLSASLDSAIHSSAAKETGAVVITIPVGVAQLAFKALRLFLSVFVILFDLGFSLMIGNPTINLAAAVAPNSKFNTTKAAYRRARLLTGANVPASVVQNYS